MEEGSVDSRLKEKRVGFEVPKDPKKADNFFSPPSTLSFSHPQRRSGQQQLNGGGSLFLEQEEGKKSWRFPLFLTKLFPPSPLGVLQANFPKLCLMEPTPSCEILPPKEEAHDVGSSSYPHPRNIKLGARKEGRKKPHSFIPLSLLAFLS